MAKKHSIGEAGAFYTSYIFALNNFIVAPTSRNATGVDLVVCTEDGIESCNIQVKTSSFAYRHRRFGSEGYEWQVGFGVVNKFSQNYWYSFVDLKRNSPDDLKRNSPDIFIVPSYWVAKFVLPYPDFSRGFFFLPIGLAEFCKNNTELIRKVLQKDVQTLNFANTWHKDLVHWGDWKKYF